MAARKMLAKHPLLLLYYWQLLCPLLSLMSPLAVAILTPPHHESAL